MKKILLLLSLFATAGAQATTWITVNNIDDTSLSINADSYTVVDTPEFGKSNVAEFRLSQVGHNDKSILIYSPVASCKKGKGQISLSSLGEDGKRKDGEVMTWVSNMRTFYNSAGFTLCALYKNNGKK